MAPVFHIRTAFCAILRVAEKKNSSFYFVTNQCEYKPLCISVINLEKHKSCVFFAPSNRNDEAKVPNHCLGKDRSPHAIEADREKPIHSDATLGHFMLSVSID